MYMDWVANLLKVRGKQIPDYRVDAIAEWVASYKAKEGRLPSKEEVLGYTAHLCRLNFWNVNTVDRIKEFVFGEKLEKPPQNPTEALAKELGVVIEDKEAETVTEDNTENKVEGDKTSVE
jgi:hypothetical protein